MKKKPFVMENRCLSIEIQERLLALRSGPVFIQG